MTIKRMPAPPALLTEQAQGHGHGTLGHVIDTAQTRTRRERHRTLNAADGTLQLLVSGFWTMLVGLVAAALTVFVFGGVGPQGAHSNPGWLSLMVAMMSTPFAILLLLLGGAKWLRNYGLSKASAAR
jgi:hypothetical protein